MDRKDDVWLSEEDLAEYGLQWNPNFGSLDIKTLHQYVDDGYEAHRVIVQFHDWFLSTLHPQPPEDASSNERFPKSAAFVQTENNLHPSAVDPASYINSSNESLRTCQYCTQLNVTERHNCGPYCLRQKKSKDSKSGLVQYCRFGFPYNISSNTHVKIQQYVVGSKRGKQKLKGERGKKQGSSEVKFRIEIVRRINDRHLNSHSRPLLESWQANMDMQLIVDSGKVVDYMTKYVTKTEAASTKTITRMMRKLLKSSTEEGLPISSVLKRTMGKLIGERTVSQQETCHLSLSLPLVSCTHNFNNLNLENSSKQLDLDLLKKHASSNNGDRKIIGPAMKRTLMDGYSLRLDPCEWADNLLEKAVRESVRNMPLCEFVKFYDIGKRGNHAGKIIKRKREKTVTIFYPHIKSDANASTYPLYCKYSLIKFREWARDSADMHPYDGIENPTDQDYVSIWESYVKSCEEKGFWIPDSLQREIDNHILNKDKISRNTSDSAIAIDDMQVEAPSSEKEIEDAAFVEIETELPHSRNDNADDPDDVQIRWDKNHDWSKPVHQYDKSIDEYLKMLDKFIEDDKAGLHNRMQNGTVHRNSLNENQRVAHDLFVAAVKSSCGRSTSESEKKVGKLQVMTGQGGCGKPHVLKCINSTLSKMGIKGGNFATTGIAAAGIGASTIHSYNRGFGIPVNAKNGYKKLSPRALKRLRKIHKNIRYVTLDEYSMLKQREVYYLNQRCKEIFDSDEPFGGLVVLLVGDIGQLPAVNGSVLWANDSANAEDQMGRTLYECYFNIVTCLTENVRLDSKDEDAVAYSSILKRLHDGQNTRWDVDVINSKCSRHRMGGKAWKEKGFDSPEAVHLFTRNTDVDRHNKVMLKKIDNPVALIRAENIGEAKQAAAKDTMNLDNSLYLAVGANVIITNNVYSSVANGSRGVVKDLMYEEGKSAPHLPAIIWIEIDTFNGPSFFPNDPTRAKWFPITPISHSWFTIKPKAMGKISKVDDNNDYQENIRKMLPIRLSWALTIWKAQGQTIRTKFVLHSGKDKKEHGLTYTAFSRATRFSDVGTFDGFEVSRFLIKIPTHKKMGPRLAEERRYKVMERKTRLLYEQL